MSFRHPMVTDEGACSPKDNTMNNTQNARKLRSDMTEAERLLWHLLRSRRFSGFKFRRQVPVGPYIADFLCYEARLIVECDGGQHADNCHDKARDAWLNAQGFRVLRFWNADIFTARAQIAETLYAALIPIDQATL